jgi:hypothetical protein
MFKSFYKNRAETHVQYNCWRTIANLIWVLFLIQTGTAIAATRYVEKSGNDSFNSCTSAASPCRTITHAITAASSGDLIKIGVGIFTEYQIVISKNLSLTGTNFGVQGSIGTVVEPESGGTVFVIDSFVTCQLEKMWIRNGTNSGIYNLGTLTVQNAAITNNKGNDAGGIANEGTLTLTQVSISKNEGGTGGGLFNFDTGTAILNKVDISFNTGHAGGFDNRGFLALINSTVRGNDTTQDCCTGVNLFGATLFAANSTISGNTKGALINSEAFVALHYVTIAKNGGSYGAIFAHNGSVILSRSIISENGQGAQCGEDIVGSFSDGGYNVYQDQSCGFFLGSGSIVAEAQLKPLAFNGGPTATHALQKTSPAIDLVPSGLCFDEDQRGFPRPVDGNDDGVADCDAGAFEYQKPKRMSR